MLHARLRAAAGRDRIPTDGLVAWYTMDNISGSTLVDEMGDYDGALEGGWSSTSGAIGSALRFDGDAAAVRLGAIPQNDPLQFLGDFTISFWINHGVVIDSYPRIIDKSNGGNGSNGWAVITNDFDFAGNRLNLHINGEASGAQTNLGVDIPIGSWHHVVIVCSGSTATAYLDGSSYSSITIPTRVNVQTDCSIGTWNHSNGREFNGDIDQMRLYTRRLTSGEVSLLYNEGA